MSWGTQDKPWDDVEMNFDSIKKTFQTTRVHKRYERIVADSFINNFKGKYRLVNVKNSTVCFDVPLELKEALSLISDLGLTPKQSKTFANLVTYRLPKSWKVIEDLENSNLVASDFVGGAS